MKFAWLCKRQYTHKDLLNERFGRLYHLPVQLGRLGHDGLVVAGDYVGTKDEEISEGNVVFASSPLNLVNLFSFIWKTYLRFKGFKPDVLIAGGDSYLGLIGLLMARKLKIPFVFDVFDDYASFSSDKIPGMRYIYLYTLRKADLTIAVSDALLERLSPLVRDGVVLGNGTDLSLFRPIQRKEARERLLLTESDVIVGYFGSINQSRGIETLIGAVDGLQNVKLLIAGHNSLDLKFNKAFIDYRGNVPQNEIPFYINACNVVVIPYLPNLQDSVGNACKISEYLACGVPVVATKVADHERIFAEAPEVLCEPGNPLNLRQVIKRQIGHPRIVNFPPEMTWERLGSRMRKYLSRVLSPSGPKEN